MNDLIGYDDDENDLSGYGEEIVGADDDEIMDILSGLGYEEDDFDDVEGYDDDDDEDELGRGFMSRLRARMRGRSRGRGRRPTRRRRRRTYGRRATIQKVQAKDLRRYPLGLGVTSITAGASAIISASPQLPFKLERIVTAVTGFTIANVSVGTVSQFVAAGAVPTEVFAPNAVGVALRGDTAVPGVQIQITVTNITAGTQDFTGALIGLVAQ